MSIGQPFRYPNATSREVMTRRGWWLVVVNFCLPGAAQALAGNRRLGRFGLVMTAIMWALVCAFIAVSLAWPTTLYTLAAYPFVLWGVAVVLVFYSVLWVILTIDTLRLVRIIKVSPGSRFAVPVVALLALIGVSGLAAYGGTLALSAGMFVSSVFVAGPSQPPVDGRYNIMLLGGDAGADRDGLRPDSISVVSIDAETGAATMIGLPRDLENVPFPRDSPLYEMYPDGYGAIDGCNVSACKLNSLYTEVELKSPELYPNATSQGSDPGLEAMRDAVEGVLGIPVPYYVLIDMQGFADLIDALGGVTINVTERVPKGAGHDEDNNPVPIDDWIEAGEQHLDGVNALWYARSRFGSSDYERMMRQRQLQEAVLAQFNPANVVAKFQGIASAGAEVVKTNIPQSMLGYFVDLGMKTKELPLSDLELVPPTVDPSDPDFDEIQALVREALWPPTPVEGTDSR